jgi:DNA repair exonuclease SbcCD ATPase subunit
MNGQIKNSPQPNHEKSNTELFQAIEELRQEIKDKVIPEEKITAMINATVQETFKAYPTRDEVKAMMDSVIGGSVSGLNRSVSELTENVNKLSRNVDETFKGFTRQLMKHEHDIGELEHEQGAVKRRQDEQQNTLAALSANQEQMLTLLRRTEESARLTDQAIRGNGDEKKGINARVSMIESMLPTISANLEKLADVADKNAQLATENARLHREQLAREQKREDDRQALYASLRQSAMYVVTRGGAWAVSTGVIGTALVAIGQALVGG